MNGKVPLDIPEGVFIQIITKNKFTMAVTDGKGHAYKIYGEGYDVFNSVAKTENLFNPEDYEYHRRLTSFDF